MQNENITRLIWVRETDPKQLIEEAEKIRRRLALLDELDQALTKLVDLGGDFVEAT